MTLVVDNSTLTSIARCTTQALLEYKFNLALPDAKVEAEAGKGAHKALAKHFSGYGPHDCITEFEQHYRHISEQYVASDSGWDWQNIRDILLYYFESRPLERFSFEVLQVETGRKVRLDEGIEFFALEDALVRDKESGAIYPMDHKLRSKITAWWLKKFSLGSQLTGYQWAAREELKQLVPGALLNAIEAPKLPIAENKKCYLHKIPKSECRLLHATFHLKVIDRHDAVIEEWRKLAISLAKRWQFWRDSIPALEYIVAAPMEGMFTGACTFCQFKEFCKSGRDTTFAKNYYKESVWRPWDGVYGSSG